LESIVAEKDFDPRYAQLGRITEFFQIIRAREDLFDYAEFQGTGWTTPLHHGIVRQRLAIASDKKRAIFAA
jgi:hypothetical protein